MGKRKKKEANLNMPRKKRADELAAAEAKEAEEEARLREASSDVPMADLVASFADELRCQLCSEIFEDPCTLPCGHNFCRACAEERLHGKGVYKNECPHERCTQPCYVKDLERNHTIASIVATLRDAVAPFAAGFDRARGREPPAARADANQGKKNADAGWDDERGDADGVPTTEDGVPTTTEDGVPTTTEECGRLAEEIREINAVANYLQRELEKIRAARAAKAARAAEDAAAARGNQTQTQTQTQTQRGSTQALGQCARLNMTQARHLYLMAHGEAPKRGATLKKLRAAAAKLDPDVVAAVLGAEDEVQVAGSNPDGDEERTRNARNARNDANRRRRETVAAEGVAAAAVPAGERRRARGDAAAAPSAGRTSSKATSPTSTPWRRFALHSAPSAVGSHTGVGRAALARCALKKSAVVDARPARSTARRWEVGSETETSSEEKAPHRTAEAFAVFFAATGRATVMRAEVEVRAIMKSVRWIDNDLCDAVRSGGVVITSRTLSYPGDVSCSRSSARGAGQRPVCRLVSVFSNRTASGIPFDKASSPATGPSALV